MLEATQVLMHVYQQIARSLAAKYEIDYPAGVEQVISMRLEELAKRIRMAYKQRASQRRRGLAHLTQMAEEMGDYD